MDARTDRMPDRAIGVMGIEVPPEGRPLLMSPVNRRRWENFKANNSRVCPRDSRKIILQKI